MKVQIVRPFSADVAEGLTEPHYGVMFTVAESSSKKSVLVAELPDDEAQAMIDAGRVEAVIETPDAEAAQAEADRLAAEAAQAEADKAKGKK